MSITITYALYPPHSIDPSTVLHPSSGSPVPSSNTLVIPAAESLNTPVSVSASASTSASAASSPLPLPNNVQTYYSTLSMNVLRAQTALNEHLTAWKDAIGDQEKSKEDLGKIAHGQGKAARMMLAEKRAAGSQGVAEVVDDDDEDEDEDEDEDDVDDDGDA